jgi:hypothetical protein
VRTTLQARLAMLAAGERPTTPRSHPVHPATSDQTGQLAALRERLAQRLARSPEPLTDPSALRAE